VPARHHGEIDPDDLYGLPLDRFVTQRGALARSLRAEGRRDEAARVAGLRRPSIAAWVVNQLVRTQRPAVAALFDAGDELRQAQADLLAGRGAGRELRAAGDRERLAVDRLIDDARGLLTSQGDELSAATLDRVADTLHAAATDAAAREQVRGGRLERELRHVGLGLGEAAAVAPPSPAAKATGRSTKAASGPSSGPPKPSERDRAAQRRAEGGDSQRDRASERRAEAERIRREREAARAAKAAAAAARRRAESATRAVLAAEEHRRHAAQALCEADEALAVAREEATTADAALRRAQADLEDA
jgi:hypothetical protein